MLLLVCPLKCQAAACTCPVYLDVVLGCVLGEIRMFTSSVNQTRSNISSVHASALSVMVAIDAHSLRVKRYLLKRGLLQGLMLNRAAPISSYGCWLLEKESSIMKNCLQHSFPPAALHSSSSLTPRRDVCAGLHASHLSLWCSETPAVVLLFEEHVVGDQELGAGTGHGTGPGQVLKLLYEYPARLDDK